MDSLFITCPWCGKEFVRKNSVQKYCCGRCRDSANYERYITRNVGTPTGGNVSICFECKKAIGDCDWCRCVKDEIVWKPIKGWKVKKSKIHKDGFQVVECPEYEKG